MEKKVRKIIEKLAKKDRLQCILVWKKINEIIKNPQRFKPLRKPMQNKREAHVMKSFVLVYEIDESKKIVKLQKYEHHDRVFE